MKTSTMKAPRKSNISKVVVMITCLVAFYFYIMNIASSNQKYVSSIQFSSVSWVRKYFALPSKTITTGLLTNSSFHTTTLDKMYTSVISRNLTTLIPYNGQNEIQSTTASTVKDSLLISKLWNSAILNKQVTIKETKVKNSTNVLNFEDIERVSIPTRSRNLMIGSTHKENKEQKSLNISQMEIKNVPEIIRR